MTSSSSDVSNVSSPKASKNWSTRRWCAPQMHTSMGGLDFATTRRGRAALDRGDVRNLLAEPSG